MAVVELTHLDGLRISAGVMGGMVMGLVVFTLIHYVRMLLAGHKNELFVHVFTIGVSYFALVLYVAIDMAERLGIRQWTWRIPLSLFSILLGLVGLRAIVIYVHCRDEELHEQQRND